MVRSRVYRHGVVDHEDIDLQSVSELAQRTLGVNDNIMGSVNSGGRKTATEVRSSTTFRMSPFSLETSLKLSNESGAIPPASWQRAHFCAKIGPTSLCQVAGADVGVTGFIAALHQPPSSGSPLQEKPRREPAPRRQSARTEEAKRAARARITIHYRRGAPRCASDDRASGLA